MTPPVDVRASFRRFPGWSQPFWTWVTGKALPHQEPLIRHTWYSYLAATLAAFFGGLCLSAFALSTDAPFRYLELLCGWLLSLAAARILILVVAHQCIHRRFSGSRRMDACIGELVTVLTVFQDAAEFRAEHFDRHHASSTFGTKEDPPVQVLLRLGLCPGMSTRQLWSRAFVVFFSPLFYLRGFADRLKCNLSSGGWRRAGFFAWAGFWVSLPFWHRNGGSILLLGFVVPVILLAQLSALLDKLGEHAWLTHRDPRLSSRYCHVSATWGRFCGCAVPDRSNSRLTAARAWLCWSVAMALYHLPARLLVVVGDLPNHDFHHRYPGTREWMIAAYARQRDIDSGMHGGPPYTEIWGIGRAIGKMFQGLSSAREESIDASLDR